MRAVQKGDVFILLLESAAGGTGGSAAPRGGRGPLGGDERVKVPLRVGTGTHNVKGIGLVRHDSIAGRPYGSKVPFGGKEYVLLPATPFDLIETVRRKAQIVLPKDSATILLHAGVRSGSRVVEAGIGSGALTIPLAAAIAPSGKVFSYELREDFRDWGKQNLEDAGLAGLVEFKLGDVTKGIEERDVDAVVLDIPNPWDGVVAAKEALVGGGVFAAYSPLVSQVEQVVGRLRETGFVDLRVLENIQREWVVGERGSRPNHDMLGHTAFLVFARKTA